MDASDNSGDKITPQLAFQLSADILIWVIIAIQLIVAIYGRERSEHTASREHHPINVTGQVDSKRSTTPRGDRRNYSS